MECVVCGSAAASKWRNDTAHGYRWSRCRDCGRQFNECNGDVLNRTYLPCDAIALAVFFRLRHWRTLRGLSEIHALRGIEVSHKAIRDWETNPPSIIGDALRTHRRGTRRSFGASWYGNKTHLKVPGRWT